MSIVVAKRDGVFEAQKCRKKPSAVDRTDVSDVDRTDRLHRQSTFYLTHCAAGDAAPGEAQPGSTLFTHWATWVRLCQQDMGVVAPRGHGICTPLGHPGGEPQPHHFEWRTNVFSHAPHLCMPPMSKLAILLLGFYVYLYILIEFCVGAQCCYISSWNTHARTPWACADSPRRHVGYHTQHHD